MHAGSCVCMLVVAVSMCTNCSKIPENCVGLYVGDMPTWSWPSTDKNSRVLICNACSVESRNNRQQHLAKTNFNFFLNIFYGFYLDNVLLVTYSVIGVNSVRTTKAYALYYTPP